MQVTKNASAASPWGSGLRVGAGFAVPTFAAALSFGVQARALGWSTTTATLTSLLVFSGSAQFALVTVLAAGGGAAAALAAALLANIRYLAMTATAAPAFRGGRLRRALLAQAVVDASWAYARDGAGVDRVRLVAATIPQYAGWAAGTVIGAAGAGALDAHRLRLDAAFPGFFTALVVAEARRSGFRTPAAALLLTVGLVRWLPPGAAVLTGALVVALPAAWR